MTRETQAHGQDGEDAGLDAVLWGCCRAGTGWFWMARYTAWDGTVRRTAQGWCEKRDDATRKGAAAARYLAGGTSAQVFLRHRAAEYALRVLLEDGGAVGCPLRPRTGLPPGR
ncbi:hypothetical protein WDV06_16900 [Streptomyces racemochromogenes]|uniref:Uncharacterized protein n=1 Tax=Streptomyces racemochromogenes TaxID=67353 RepID=A0ABW7PEK6_9ACTN